MDDFETAEIQTGETSIFARWVRVRLYSLWLQQLNESCLFKMMIGSERLGNVFLRHHDKASAIGQAPFLVRTLAVKRPIVRKQARRGRENMQDGQPSQAVDESDRMSA